MIIKYSNQTNISFKFSWLYNSSFHKQSKTPSSGQLVFNSGFVFHNNMKGSWSTSASETRHLIFAASARAHIDLPV